MHLFQVYQSQWSWLSPYASLPVSSLLVWYLLRGKVTFRYYSIQDGFSPYGEVWNDFGESMKLKFTSPKAHLKRLNKIALLCFIYNEIYPKTIGK